MARTDSDGHIGKGSTRGYASAPGDLDGLVDDWIDLLGRDLSVRGGARESGRRGARDDDPRRPPDAAPRRDDAGLAPSSREAHGFVDVDGTSLVVTFDDHVGGSVVLLRTSGRFAHRGVSAPRGATATTWQTLGLSDALCSAVAFVADWFGAPFDAVNATRQSAHGLTWGIWNFSGERLGRCLGRWKARASDSFTALLGSAGIDIDTPPEESRSGTAPAVVLAGSKGARGTHAERILTGDPRLVAVLARAGRHLDAQLAQIDSVAHDILEPALAALRRVVESESSSDDRALTARELAALLYLDLRLGANVTRQVARAITASGRHPGNENAFLNAIAERLAAADRGVDAHNMLRILSSPELERR
jgi:hypothetical protein